MMMVLAAVLAFITIASLGWALVGGDDATSGAVKRSQVLTAARANGPQRSGATATNTPENRRKQIMSQLQEAERRERKNRMSLAARINQSGLTLNVRTFLILSVVLGFFGLALTFLISGNIFLALGVAVALGLGVPRWILSFLSKRRVKKFQMSFADAVDVIVRGIKTGLPVNDCFKIIAKESPQPLASEFSRMVESLGIGLSLPEALDRMYGRMPTPELNFFRIVIAIQQKTGGNLAEALTNLSTVLRARRMMREKIKAMSSEAVTSAMIIGSLPPLVLVVVMFANPTYIMTLFTDVRGNFMLLGAALWMTMGVLVMKKMINFKI